MSGVYTTKQLELMRLWQEDRLRRVTLLEGSVSSGKTWISLVLWAFLVASSPRDKLYLMAGRSITTLKHNCLYLLQEHVGDGNFTFSAERKEGRLFGRRILLEGANDVRSESKIRGLTLQGAYVDELTTVPADFYAMLLSRLRLPGARLIATTNPDRPTHWLRTDYILRASGLRPPLPDSDEIDMCSVKFLLDDNTTLPRDYVANIRREYTGVFYRRFILGEWCAAEGLVYPAFADNPSAFRISRSALPPLEEILIGVDFGGNRSAHAFVASGFDRGRRRLYALRSQRIKATGMSVTALVAAFGVFADGVQRDFGSVTFVFADSAEQAIINEMRLRYPALSIRNSIKNEIVDRIRCTDLLMATGRFSIIEGECATLEAALSEALWSNKALDDRRLDDGSTDIDTLDAFEYSWEINILSLLEGCAH